ncbi:uncharacterized protein LOC116255073 [Nymphaea colorata]|nr:uncharacterized protein LOC116255073 [Nymphaea colorata]XP_031486676.1 uncharacterized protein LOC116255073 [Nymphaea colorata]XP_031486678.1 uncharacterized protein LOC116255073 [Nymphaea colorata]
MDASLQSQLPEVDSLPDGFVESSPEQLDCSDPITETERQPSEYISMLIEVQNLAKASTEQLKGDNEMVSTANVFDAAAPVSDEPDCFNLNLLSTAAFPRMETSNPAAGDTESWADENEVYKIEKTRNFPVPLSDRDPLEMKFDSLEVTSRTIVETNGAHEGTVEPEEVTSSPTEVCAKMLTGLHERSVGDTRNVKLGESIEGKTKHAKRNLKSEKEFLELTWKFQQTIVERDAAIAVREKLESLCRELQRQNKILMDECKKVSADGQNMRSELSVKFHDAIKDVSNKLEEQKEDYLSQLKENDMLRNKLKHLTEQFAIAEEEFKQQLKKKILELQLAELKLQQQQERSSQEQAMMKVYTEQVSQLLETEKNLRMQLASDGEKFQQFQEALSKSNEVFETFKQEMEKMAKSVKELKKENTFLKSKCEKSDFTLIKLVDEREAMKKQMEKMKNQKEKLESLCRSLQAERKHSLPHSSDGCQISDEVKVIEQK